VWRLRSAFTESLPSESPLTAEYADPDGATASDWWCNRLLRLVTVPSLVCRECSWSTRGDTAGRSSEGRSEPPGGDERQTGDNTMQRRDFVVGMGALASGSAAVLGSGAFSSVTAERSVSVQVRSDSNAYLGISGYPDYTEETNGTLEINFDGNGQASGINGNATTEFTDVLQITNQGTDDALVWINLNDLNSQIGSVPGTGDGEYVTSYLSMDNYGNGMDAGDGTGNGTSGGAGAAGVFVAPGEMAEIALGFYNIPEGDIGSVYDTTLGVNAAAQDSEFFKYVVPNYDFPGESGGPSVPYIDGS